MAEGRSCVLPSSQPGMECTGCSELRRQVEDLRNILLSTPLQQKDDFARCCSTYISERKQQMIDRVLLDSRLKADASQEACEKAAQENRELKKQLDEKVNEVVVLKEQNAVYAADFQLEREDRERAQNRLTELEQQLADAYQRIAELEDDKQRLSVSFTTMRHQVPNQHVPVHREFCTNPTTTTVPAYTEHHHLPTYNSVYQSLVPHQSRQCPRTCGRSYDVCDHSNATASTNITDTFMDLYKK